MFDLLSESASMSSTFAAAVPFRLNLANVSWMGQFNYPVIARLTPGVALEQARAELNVIQQSVAQIARRNATSRPSCAARSCRSRSRLSGARGSVLLLLGADRRRRADRVREPREPVAHAGAGSNAGRRGSKRARRQPRAARPRDRPRTASARGSGRSAGLLVAREGLNLFVKTAPDHRPRVNDVVIDGRVLAFAASVAIIAGLCVELLPAWRMGRGDVQATLRGGGYGATDRGGLRVRATLLATQVALSVTLLVVTGLFVTSFVQLLRVDPGFSPDGVVAVEIAPVARRYPDAKARATL